MPGSTTRGLPYPFLGTDPPNIPSDIQDLAEAVDAQLTDLDTLIATEAPQCVVVRTTNGSVANNVEDSVLFVTELYDPQAMHSTVSNTSRITIPAGEGGMYMISGSLHYAANSTGIRRAKIRKNGGNDLAVVQDSNPNASNDSRLNPATIARLSGGDYLELVGFQTSGSALVTVSGGDPTSGGDEAGIRLAVARVA